MFRSDVKQNKGNNLTFGVIRLALEVMSINFPSQLCAFLKQILVALFTVAAGNEARVDSVTIQPYPALLCKSRYFCANNYYYAYFPKEK